MADDDAKSGGMPIGVGATVTLVIGLLGVVGVSGDYIVRTVRDQPDAFSNVVRWAVAGAAIIAIAVTVSSLRRTGPVPDPPPSRGQRILSHIGRWGGLAGAIVVLIAGFVAVGVGTTSVHNPEQPRTSLSETSSANIVTISADVSGAGLAPDDEMLVQVIGLTALADPVDGMKDICENSQGSEKLDAEQGRLLAWELMGPDNKGNVTGTVKVEVPLGTFGGACAFSVVGDTAKVDTAKEDSRNATAAYIRLNEKKSTEDTAPPERPVSRESTRECPPAPVHSCSSVRCG